MPKELPILARNLRYLRQTRSVTQEAFAEELGIKRSLLGAYEEGRATPRYDMLDRMAGLFRVSISDLLNKELAPEGYAPPKRGRAQAQAAPKPGRPAARAGRAAEALPTPLGLRNGTEPGGLLRSEDAIIYGTSRPAPPPPDELAVVSLEEMARYPQLCQQPAYLHGLGRMSLPWSGGAGRAFALAERRLLICTQVRNWYTLQESRRYVVVHQGGLHIGPIQNRLDSRDRTLIVHPEEDGPEVPVADTALIEIWQVDYELGPAQAPTAELPPALDKRLRQILTAVKALG